MEHRHSKNSRMLDIYQRLCEGRIIVKSEEAQRSGVDERSVQRDKRIQDDAKKQSSEELQEAKEMFFEDDPETYRMMVNTIMTERKAMVDVAQRFMIELSEDFKRLNYNSDKLLTMGMKNVDKYLSPMARSLGVTSEVGYLPTKDTDEDYVEVD